MSHLSSFPLSERLSVLWSLASVWWSAGRRLLSYFLRRCAAVCAAHQKQTQKNTHVHAAAACRLVSLPPSSLRHSFSFMVSRPLTHTRIRVSTPTCTHMAPPPPLELSSVSLSPFPHEFSTSSLSSLTSSCVTQLRSISSSPICYKYRLPTQEC